MGIFVTIIAVAFFGHWTCSLLNMHWSRYEKSGVVGHLDLPGGRRPEEEGVVTLAGTRAMPFTHFLRGRTRFPLFLMLPLSFYSNYYGIIVFTILSRLQQAVVQVRLYLHSLDGV